jgi:probable phosphoglycerate mutase
MIYLARHGETDWNALGRYQGRMESTLSPLGLRQAAALAAMFAQRRARGEPVPARVISSPMRRCMLTAAASAGVLGVPVEPDERLIEIAHGTWDGRLRDEIAHGDAARYAAWRSEPAGVTFENGESLKDVDARWRAFEAGLPRDGADLLVCTHDAVLRVALLSLTHRPLTDFWSVHAENGAFALVHNTNGQLRLLTECVNAHLGADRAAPARQAL